MGVQRAAAGRRLGLHDWPPSYHHPPRAGRRAAAPAGV